MNPETGTEIFRDFLLLHVEPKEGEFHPSVAAVTPSERSQTHRDSGFSTSPVQYDLHKIFSLS